jgi:putative ABC transport system permease protein
MGRLVLIGRLAGRDLRHRWAQAVLLLLAITAATATLTLGLALHGVTSHPYRQTRADTRGPDVVAQLGAAPVTIGRHGPGQASAARAAAQAAARATAQVTTQTRALLRDSGVIGHSGPYPVASALLRARGRAAGVEVEGRSAGTAALDQPKLTAGSWVRAGGVVIERTFADALGVGVGDPVTLNGRPYTVTGIAVTAAEPPYPNLCFVGGGGCVFDGVVSQEQADPGLAWTTEPDARALSSAAAPLAYLLNLRLRDPAGAQAFADKYDNAHLFTGPGSGSAGYLVAWPTIAAGAGLLVQDEQSVLLPGSWLAGLLAVASVAVLAGGRMAERTRRVGLLKAVGATPGLVAAVLLGENLALALLAAAAGLTAGWLAAPLLTHPGAGLVGTPGAPGLTLATVGLVVVVALAVALAATLVPAVRGARASTVSALAGAGRRPRRRARLVALSRWLPVPLLLGLRLVARRPRRALLGAFSIAVTATGLVAVLTFHASADRRLARLNGGGLGNPVLSRDEQMLLVITVVLLALSALNAVVATWATVLDTRQASALARALGATPWQVSAGVSAAQVLPALPGALLGIPLGIGLFAAANGGGSATTVVPPAWWLVAAVLGILLAVAGLTAIPARVGARRPAGEILQSETA